MKPLEKYKRDYNLINLEKREGSLSATHTEY